MSNLEIRNPSELLDIQQRYQRQLDLISLTGNMVLLEAMGTEIYDHLNSAAAPYRAAKVLVESEVAYIPDSETQGAALSLDRVIAGN